MSIAPGRFGIATISSAIAFQISTVSKMCCSSRRIRLIPPRWKTYLAPHVAEPIDDIYTASASAVLLFEASDRLFAVTFGGGRHLLEPDVGVVTCRGPTVDVHPAHDA